MKAVFYGGPMHLAVREIPPGRREWHVPIPRDVQIVAEPLPDTEPPRRGKYVMVGSWEAPEQHFTYPGLYGCAPFVWDGES